jgi:hypothetical protein
MASQASLAGYWNHYPGKRRSSGTGERQSRQNADRVDGGDPANHKALLDALRIDLPLDLPLAAGSRILADINFNSADLARHRYTFLTIDTRRMILWTL